MSALYAFRSGHDLELRGFRIAIEKVHETMSDTLPTLEEPCEDCDGKGKIDARRDGNALQFGGPCNTCRGVGVMPTAAGQQIITLMRHQRQKGDF